MAASAERRHSNDNATPESAYLNDTIINYWFKLSYLMFTESDEVYSVGSNQFFQLGWGQIGLNYSMPGKIEKLNACKVVQVACLDSFSMAVTDGKLLLICVKSFLFSWYFADHIYLFIQ